MTKLILALCFVTALAFGVLCGYVIWQTRQDALREGYEINDNLAQAISQDISRTFELYDLSLQGVIEALAEPGLDQVPPAIRHSALFDNSIKASYLKRIMVLDAVGNAVEESRSSNNQRSNFSSRRYFTTQRDDPNVGLYVSKPLRTRSGEWIIALSRRISKPDDSFDGVVVGTLDLEYFEALFSNLNAGNLARFAVIRTDGTMITRYPFAMADVGRDLRKSRLFLLFPATRSGIYDDDTTTDGVRRIYSYRQVGNLPLLITVGSAQSTILSSWIQKTLLVATLMASIAIAMGALAFCFIRELRHRRLIEKKLALSASTDPLTALPNRRCFQEFAETAWKRSIREQSPLSILVVDIDYFKAYNDVNGHLQGDEALKQVAVCLRGALRGASDFAARYGGEEFVVLLPDTAEEDARKVAENIRRRVAMLEIYHQLERGGGITVSVGATTTVPCSSDSFARALNTADEALFDAKRKGRNMIVHSKEGVFEERRKSLHLLVSIPGTPEG